MCHHLLAFVFEALPKLLDEIKILLFRCTSIGDNIWLMGVIYFNQCMQNQPSHCAVNRFCALVLLHQDQRGLKLVHAAFFFF